MRVPYNWLKEFVDIRFTADELAKELTSSGLEVISITKLDKDFVFEIEVTANRPDLLSVLGIARELSAITNKKIKLPKELKNSYFRKAGSKGRIKITLEDRELCNRYVGRIVRGVKVGPSPTWLQERLSMVGLRSINNIVDITNYVLIELGQPLHAFDLDKIEGGKIFVRKAKRFERLVTIDGVERELDPQVLLILDKIRPIAIAGIMGGKDTEVSQGTKNVLLESAYFDPYFIRNASRRLGLASESSYRFERGVDPGLVLSGSIRATKLIEKLAKAHAYGGPVDIGILPKRKERLAFSLEKANKLLGIDIPAKAQKALLKRLGFTKILKERNRIYVNIPSHRRDIRYEIDIVEEIARLYGYDKVPAITPNFWIQKKYPLENIYLGLEDRIRKILTSQGIDEVLSYSLISRQHLELLGEEAQNSLRIKNPLSLQQEFLRTSILPENLELLRFNLNRKNENLKFFEIGKVFLKTPQGILETPKLSIAICGITQPHWKEKKREYNFFDLKGILEVLFSELGILEYKFVMGNFNMFKDTLNCQMILKEKNSGVAGEVKKEILDRFDINYKTFLAELDLENIFKVSKLEKRFTTLPRFPSIRRDLALVVDEGIFSSQIIDEMWQVGRGLVKGVDVFDQYFGEQIPLGKKGLAFSVEYRDETKTLRDLEVSELHLEVCEALVKRFGVEIRR